MIIIRLGCCNRVGNIPHLNFYRYGFNGKENDDEVKGEGSQQEYGMRIYDPRVGRFLSVDALAANFTHFFRYQFAGNMSTWAIDVDGLKPLPYLEWECGGWSTSENFKLIQGSRNHIEVINFGDLYGDGKNYIAIRDQKEKSKWCYASYEDLVGSFGNAQKGNYMLYNPDVSDYQAWTPDGYVPDDVQIKSMAKHLGEFGRAMENMIVQGTIFGVTAPLGGVLEVGDRD